MKASWAFEIELRQIESEVPESRATRLDTRQQALALIKVISIAALVD
jgi:hypothetical protein